MGLKYKRKLEIEWAGKSMADMKSATLREQANKNISRVIKGKFKKRSK